MLKYRYLMIINHLLLFIYLFFFYKNEKINLDNNLNNKLKNYY